MSDTADVMKGVIQLGQYFNLISKSPEPDHPEQDEMVCAWCLGGTAKLFEWAANPQCGVLPFLLRRSNEGGGGDIQDLESAQYAGRWAGRIVLLVGDYDESGLHHQAYETFRNISPELAREYNQFMGCEEYRLNETLCSSCQERAKSREERSDGQTD